MQNNDYHVPEIGRRISLHGNKGTIRYIGEVQGTHGTWLGIEWDNLDRGKHSGEKNGKQYFTCRVLGSGSFIRPSSAISYGQSFLSALISKYVELPNSNGRKETVILGSSNGAIEIEAIGLDKVRGKLARLERLREISLDTEDIAYADSPGEIRKTCPNVRNLDLSNSLLASWDQVARIAAELPVLRELTLNCTRFSDIYDTANMGSVFLALEELRLNETMISWPEMILLIINMPRLRTFELGYNNMERLGGTASRNEPYATKLEALNLDENKLYDWNNVMLSISPFKLLDRLILTANQFRQIPQASVDSALPNVKHLGLQDNKLAEWRDVDALNSWLPNLKNLNISGNQLLSRSTDFRQQAIARLPRLEALNGTAISIKERIDSEIYYLNQIARNTQKSAEEREREFPRWKKLCAKHGAPEETSTVKARDTLADRLISMYIHRSESAEPDPHVNSTAPSARTLMAQLSPPSTLRVLPTMPIRLLRPKLLKSLQLASDHTRKALNLAIWMEMDDGGLRKIELEEENRDLAWAGIQDGSHIIVFTSQSDHD